MKPDRRGNTHSNSGPAQNGSGQALIEMRQVVKTFHNAAGDFTVLKDINVAFHQGEFASIVGRSGSGKSTLLNMMTGIDHPSSGMVRIGDAILQEMNEGQMSVWRGRNLGIVFQFFQLLPTLTLLENVMLPMDFGDLFPALEREKRAAALLDMVGLAGLEHKYPAAVSGGQQQSAAVARALANDPPILVADEPTGNLDSRTAERVLEIFEEQVVQGKTVLMVTHDKSLARRAQRILIISDGVLINEHLTRALPDLPHSLLFRLNQESQFMHLRAGEVVQGQRRQTDLPGKGLLVVVSGALEAVASGRRGTQVVAERLEPGSLFSAEDRRLLGRALVGLRAVKEEGVEDEPSSAIEKPSAAEMLWLPELPDSPELHRALAEIAQHRVVGFREASRHRGEKGLIL